MVAAGNDAGDACYKSPASAVSAITVGSTSYETNSDTVSSFSNYGTCLDIWAPGSDITSAWWSSDTAVNTISGTSMVRAYERLRRHFHHPHAPSPRCADSGVDLHSIHTQACPLVAGVAAQYLEQNPTHTPATVATALLDAATQMSASEFYSRGSPREFLYSDSFSDRYVHSLPRRPPTPAIRLTEGNGWVGRFVHTGDEGGGDLSGTARSPPPSSAPNSRDFA